MKKVPRVGAAAFAAGLFLVGPQAVGVASADGQEGGSSASAGRDDGASSSSPSSKGRADRGAARSRGGTPAAGTPRRAGAGSSVPVQVPAAAAARGVRASAVVPVTQPDVRPEDSAGAVGSSETLADTAVPAGVGPVTQGDVAVPAALPVTALRTASPRVGSAISLLPSWAAAATAAPNVSPVPAPPVVEQLSAGINVFLHRVGNWLAGLPENNVTTFLEGALLMVRRTLFNRAPNVTPVQETTTSEGLILGSLGVVDPEDDSFRVELAVAPEHGYVEFFDGDKWRYTPNGVFAGSDSFVARVITESSGWSLPFAGSAAFEDVTVLVGEGAPTNPFGSGVDPIDATLYVENAAGTIAVDKLAGPLGNRYGATLTLDAGAVDDQVLWLDAQGRGCTDAGSCTTFTVGELLADSGGPSKWDEFAEAAALSADGVMLGFDFVDDAGVETTLILSNVSASVNAAGQYVLSGELSANPEEQGDIDQWDVLGSHFKDNYEHFLDNYLQGGPGHVTGDLFLSTWSPVTYANEIAGADPGIDAADVLPAAQPGGATNLFGSTISAMEYLQSGKVVVGLLNGEVWQFTPTSSTCSTTSCAPSPGAGWNKLQGAGWGTSVEQIIEHGQGFIVGLGNGSVQQWTGTGTSFNELMGTGWGSKVTAMIPRGDGVIVALDSGAVEYCKTAGSCAKQTDWTELQGTGWGQGVSVMVPYAQGFVVGLGTTDGNPGAVEYYNLNDNTWRELQGSDWGARVKAMIAWTKDGDSDGLIVGLSDGSVNYYDGSSWSTALDSTGGWFSSGEEVTSIIGNGTGYVVGWSEGSLQRMPSSAADAEFEQLSTSWSSGVQGLQPYGKGFVVSLDDGSVYFWEPVVAVGDGPTGIAIANGKVYVAQYGANDLTVIGVKDDVVTKNAIDLDPGALYFDTGAAGVAITPDGKRAYIADAYHDAVQMADLTDDSATSVWIEVGTTPEKMAISPDGNHLYVTNKNTTVDVINIDPNSPKYNTVEFSPGGFTSPYGVAVAENGKAYVANKGSNTVSVIDNGNKVGADITVGSAPWGVATSDRGYAKGYVYVSNSNSNSVSVIDTATNTVATTIGLDAAPGDLVVSPDGNLLYVTATDKVVVIDLLPVKTSIADPKAKVTPVLGAVYIGPPGSEAWGLAAVQEEDGGAYVYVSNNTESQVAVLNVANLITGRPDSAGFKQLQGSSESNNLVVAGQVVGDTTQQFVIGRQDGSVIQWAGASFVSLVATDTSLSETALKSAIKYVLDNGQPFATSDDGTADPFFNQVMNQPACGNASSCTGSFYSFSTSPDLNYGWSYEYALGSGGQNLTLAFDVIPVAYGYIYVPAGVWSKLKISEYAAAAVAGVEVGPSLTVGLIADDESQTFTFQETELASKGIGSPIVVGPALLEFAGTVSAKLDVELGGVDDMEELKAYAYAVPGIQVGLNTQGQEGLSIGGAYYMDISYDDFTKIDSITITPTLTPAITATLGWFTPTDTPIIGKVSVATIDAGVEFPMTAPLTVALGKDPAFELDIAADLTFAASLLAEVTDSLAVDTSVTIASGTTGDVLT